ncbi:two component, sigma54 specific, transcriptional regulator, Fis family [Denitrovibrio acetiphilus DSM 12809]|uniref:Two component, sigma54 specific, transcriptional regulator, Fis family n=1 Tax=Denitrovibrio acetiphilus (strain DSM 12809 / NBRC 114555 / N2460) TaxID=522772 RepID=D4H8P1_DENA2|nr:sigma-54 dependent transcriptional regulator [Denitrovibrio acetiphilus]ADD68390.1 two component, sigma54 specific, transcriptional regulator, Fis family [Denitrovibrio acetiphilus DSM 12809]
MTKVLLVDDDNSLLEILRLRFQSCGYTPFAADNSQKAVSLIKSDVFDAAVFDMRLDDGKTGLELLREIKEIDSELPVIFLTAYGTIDDAVQSMKEGAFSYLTKPFDYKELIAKVEKAVQQCSFSRQLLRINAEESDSPISKTIIGKSSKTKMIRERIAIAAKSDANVFIYGESGTGKELVARMLHQSSLRSDKPFVAFNSSAIPETLMESELFGYEKGAFTGADKKKKGFFEQAQGGTVFIDEISEMPVSMQTKLLRVLENREVSPLGSEKTIKLDIRLVTASNKNLKDKIENDEFRADLFYRIHVIEIEVPALRDRREDIPLLCGHFLKKYTDRYSLGTKSFSGDAIDKMVNYDWPGNIRELQNVIECAVVLTSVGTIKGDNIKLAHESETYTQVYREAKKEFEASFLKQLMERAEGNISKASRISDIYRADLYDLLKKHSIDPADFR